MKIIQRRDLIRKVRDAWNNQYKDREDGWRFFDGTTVGEVRSRLSALDLETCSVEDLGLPGGWVDNICDECGEKQQILVHLGDEPDYDARWQRLCGKCLQKAVDLLVATPVVP